MTKEQAYNQYQFEVALFEQWGTKNIISFEEWLEIKNLIIKDGNDY